MYSPAQDLVFHIFSSKMMMAARWERSPVSLNMFMSAGVSVETTDCTKNSIRSNNDFFFLLYAMIDTRNMLTEASKDGENGEHRTTWLGGVAKSKAPNATFALLANHNKAIWTCAEKGQQRLW